MIVWVSHVKVEHRQGLIKETRCSNAAGFLLLSPSSSAKLVYLTLRKANVLALLAVINFALFHLIPLSLNTLEIFRVLSVLIN